jgi:hypothetical protein
MLLPKVPSKPDTWRIRGIQKVEKDVATKWLRGKAEELGYPEGQGFSLAADGEHTLCATLTSYECPTIPDGCRWHLDEDLIGWTPLNDPEDAELDIIAITGLGGHALGSFRSADGKFIWLRDFGPRDIPKARFITYGYNTKVVASKNTKGVAALASTLLDGLVKFRRRTQTQQRPMCFVCHSLGGVVLKEALVQASYAVSPEHATQHKVTVSTLGFVMMGVPNLGLRHDQLMTVVGGQRNEEFVRNLLTGRDNEPSEYLDRLTEDFSRVCGLQKAPWRIILYYEMLPSPTLEVGLTL